MPPAAAATVLECLRLIQEEPKHLENLWKNARLMNSELNRMGYNTLNSQTPVIPLLLGDDFTTFTFAHKLYEYGVFATPVVRPAVPEGCGLIRTSYMATHTRTDLQFALDALEKLGKEFGIIGNSSRQQELAELARTHFGAKAVATATA
jgi:8-amino-7-oxononanoate synthase